MTSNGMHSKLHREAKPSKLKFSYSAKAQSAMEYLMTYGWAILIIAVILGALFQLGVFSTKSYLPAGCIPQSGFLCSNPILSASGTLSITFGTFQPMQILGTGCSVSSSEPTVFVGLNTTVNGGQTINLYFKCPFSGGIGKAFSGTLWINYTQNGADYVIEFATVTATAATYGSWPIFSVYASPQSSLSCPPYSWPSTPSLDGYTASSHGYWEALGTNSNAGFDFYYV